MSSLWNEGNVKPDARVVEYKVQVGMYDSS
jgi:hypothetical protein